MRQTTADAVVAESYGSQTIYTKTLVGGASIGATLSNPPPSEPLNPQTLASGSWPPKGGR
ncbi:hypothetical protein AAGW05_01615 [Arthrobacter sp. LAPM80]|uniref:hypothetical protein n=1 Tax=Arthrobacter sp. LAPM80 TaxID=3141788 RepID=UPI00398BB1BA